MAREKSTHDKAGATPNPLSTMPALAMLPPPPPVPRIQHKMNTFVIIVVFGLWMVLLPLSVSIEAATATLQWHMHSLLPHHATNCILQMEKMDTSAQVEN